MNLFDKAYGAFQGLAIGDALGAPVEFKMPGEFDLVTGYQSTEHFNLPPGYWTDDTSMALALADAVIENNGYNTQAVLRNYCDWYLDGKYSSIGRCFDIGHQTQETLMYYLGAKEELPQKSKKVRVSREWAYYATSSPGYRYHERIY